MILYFLKQITDQEAEIANFVQTKTYILTSAFMYTRKQAITRKSVDGEPSHIPALIKTNRIEASYFLAYVAKYG